MKQPLPRSTRLATALVALVLPLAFVACGAEADPAKSSSESSDSAFPVEVTTGHADSGETITIAERPDAIVSLTPTGTESLFAVGAGEQVIAVDAQSDFPEEAPTTELSGHTPNVEAILGHEPDLVVTASGDKDLIASLEKAAVPTLVLPSAADLEGAYEQIARVGLATGHADAADDVVTQMKADITAAVEKAPQVEGLSYFHELDPSLYTVTGKTFIGEVYGLFGMKSIADAAKGGDLYPQLSAEYVVDANPDLVFLSDTECCGVTPEQVTQRPGWSDVSAVREGRVHVLDEDIASRWGPRIVDFVEMISEHVSAHDAGTN